MTDVLEVLSAKVSSQEKQKVDKTAAGYGMNKSEFIRAILFQKIEKFEQFLATPAEVIPTAADVDEVADLLKGLRREYPDTSESEIIKSALQLALESEKLWVSLKLKNFL